MNVENRLGVLSIPVTESVDVLLIPDDKENNDKWERVPATQGEFEPVEGYQFLAGAVEEVDTTYKHDSLILAAMREIAEESGMIVSPTQLELIGETILVEQRRDGNEVMFEVTPYYLRLGILQEEWLKARGALSNKEITNIRPRDRAVIELFIPQQIEIGVMANAE